MMNDNFIPNINVERFKNNPLKIGEHSKSPVRTREQLSKESATSLEEATKDATTADKLLPSF